MKKSSFVKQLGSIMLFWLFLFLGVVFYLKSTGNTNVYEAIKISLVPTIGFAIAIIASRVANAFGRSALAIEALLLVGFAIFSAFYCGIIVNTADWISTSAACSGGLALGMGFKLVGDLSSSKGYSARKVPKAPKSDSSKTDSET